MLAAALLFSLAAAASPAPQLRVATPGVKGVNLDEPTLAFVNEHLAAALAAAGASVLSPREVGAVLELERGKQLLECGEEDASCLAEIAQALGVDAVLVGDLARLETRYQGTFRLVSAADATAVGRWSGAAPSLEAFLVELDRAAPALAGQAAAKLGRRLQPEPGGQAPARSPSAREGGGGLWRWAPAAAGVAAAGFGAFAFSRAGGQYRALATTTPLDEPTARALRDDGKRWQSVGWVGTCLGVAGAAGSAYLLASGRGGTTVRAAPAPGGLAVAVHGVLP